MALYEPRAYQALHDIQDPPLRLLHADLKSAEGQALLHAELENSDVLLTSFRPSALVRLGAAWETLHSRFPSMCMVADAVRWLALPRAWGLMEPTSAIGGAHAGYQVYPCADGRVAVAALEPHFAARLCEAAGLPASDAHRMHDPALLAPLRAYFAGKTRAELDFLGAERDIPWETMPSVP